MKFCPVARDTIEYKTCLKRRVKRFNTVPPKSDKRIFSLCKTICKNRRG